jgi:hypothetical protein
VDVGEGPWGVDGLVRRCRGQGSSGRCEGILRAMAAAKKPSKSRSSTKKSAAKKSATTAREVATELGVEELLARGEAMAVEREALAAKERRHVRATRDPAAARPASEIHWGYSFCLDTALPYEEREALLAWFARFTDVASEPGYGYFIVGPETDPEVRRAAWDRGAAVLELEQLRAQLPPQGESARRERLAQVLARPSSERWSALAMLLSTWDEATLADVLADVERGLADWPDELRTLASRWDGRPELRRLVRVSWGELGGEAELADITMVRTQDAAGLAEHQGRFAGLRALEVSGKKGLPALVTGCKQLVKLERLVLSHPTYSEKGTAPSGLAALLRAPHLQGLRGLSLYGYTLKGADLEALAGCRQPLEHLRIQYARLQPDAGEALAELAARRRLRTLDLKYNDLGPDGARALFANHDDWGELRVLDCSANEIGDDGAAAIAAAGLHSLRWLNLASNDPNRQLGAEGARALAAGQAFGRLVTLNVYGHPIGAEGVAALLRSPNLRALRGLSAMFSGASLGELAARSGGVPVAVEELNIGHLPRSPRRFDPDDLGFLRTVRALNVDALDGDEYAALLASPWLESLEVLVLGGGYSRPEEGFAALCSAKPPPRLRYINMSGWRLTSAQARELARSRLGQQLWGLELMPSYTPPDAWYECYLAGLPLVGSTSFDSNAPNEFATMTTFREEL